MQFKSERRFGRLRRKGRISPPEPLPNWRTRPTPSCFGWDPTLKFAFDFDGYYPLEGHIVNRYGVETTYGLIPKAGTPYGSVTEAEHLYVAFHTESEYKDIWAASTDGGFTRLNLGLYGPNGERIDSNQFHLSGRTFRFDLEIIRHVIDNCATPWEAAVVVPADAPSHTGLWTPEYLARSEKRREITTTSNQHARRVRVKAPTVERFSSREIFERDNWRCGICNEYIDPDDKWPDPKSASLDHIRPLVTEGLHSRDNVQAANLVSNLRKGPRYPES